MRSLRAATPLLVLALALAACSSGAAGYASPAPSAPPSAIASTPPAAGGSTVNLADSSLGKIVVDGVGRTLYLFTADANGKSACSGACADNWPPLVSDAAPAAGPGLDASAFGTITRDDGSKQMTFHGKPLYYFAGDKAAGDTNGQGVNGKWFVVGGDGNAMGATGGASY